MIGQSVRINLKTDLGIVWIWAAGTEWIPLLLVIFSVDRKFICPKRSYWLAKNTQVFEPSSISLLPELNIISKNWLRTQWRIIILVSVSSWEWRKYPFTWLPTVPRQTTRFERLILYGIMGTVSVTTVLLFGRERHWNIVPYKDNSRYYQESYHHQIDGELLRPLLHKPHSIFVKYDFIIKLIYAYI